MDTSLFPSISICTPGAGLQQPPVASHKEQENAPYQVVNVAPAHLDVVKWADFIMYEERQDPDHGYRHEKPQRSPEEPFSGRLRKLLAVNGLESPDSDEQGDSEKDERDQQRGQPVAVMELRHGCSLDCRRNVAARSRDTLVKSWAPHFSSQPNASTFRVAMTVETAGRILVTTQPSSDLPIPRKMS